MFIKREATWFINQVEIEQSTSYEDAFRRLGIAATELFINRQVGYGKHNIGTRIPHITVEGVDIPVPESKVEELQGRTDVWYKEADLDSDLIGIVRRAMDKLQRATNLVATGEYKDTLGDPEAEGVEDSAMDCLVYCAIFVLKLRDLWSSLELETDLEAVS